LVRCVRDRNLTFYTLLEVGNMADSGSSVGSHKVDILLAIMTFIAVQMVFTFTHCKTSDSCDVPWVVPATRAASMVMYVSLLVGLVYLRYKASQCGNHEDVAALNTKFISVSGKAIVVWVVHICMSLMAPIVAGILIIVVDLPVWRRRDQSYLAKYLCKKDSETSEVQDVPISAHEESEDTGRAVHLVLDCIFLIGLLLIFEMSGCAKSNQCRNPSIVLYARVFFFAINGFLLLGLVILYCKAKKIGSDEALADAKRFRKRMLTSVIKACIFYALHIFLHLMAPLIVSTLSTIVLLPVWSDYKNSPWKKYMSSSAREGCTLEYIRLH